MGAAPSDHLRRGFLHFAEVCAERCPLYAALSPRVADEPKLLELAAHAEKGQPAPNLLFGAVHFLLLGGAEHKLRAFYRSIGGQDAPEHAWPAFIDFCAAHEREIIDLIATRRVQTNEVGRCAVLLPAFALAHHLLARPLHLIEVGASAGLNLLFDRYRYEYSDGRSAGPPSPAVIRADFRERGRGQGEHAPVSGASAWICRRWMCATTTPCAGWKRSSGLARSIASGFTGPRRPSLVRPRSASSKATG